MSQSEDSATPPPVDHNVTSAEQGFAPASQISTLIPKLEQLLNSLRNVQGELTNEVYAQCKSLLPDLTALSAMSNPVQAAKRKRGAMEADESFPLDTAAKKARTTESAPCKQLGTMWHVEPWRLGEKFDEYPPLPPICDQALAATVFRHDSVCKQGDTSYERLEWVGDAHLQVISTLLIHKSLPRASVGRCSQIRELLVKNETLAKYSQHYGFKPDLDGNMMLRDKSTLQKTATMTKIMGDVFEAYVGALVVTDPDNGWRAATDWLRGIWGLTMRNTLAQELNVSVGYITRFKSLDNGAAGSVSSDIGPTVGRGLTNKDQLSEMLVVPGIKLRYVQIPTKQKDYATKVPLMCMEVRLDGWGVTDLKLGHGMGISKKEAGQRAAAMALESKLIVKFAEKKKTFMARKRAAEALLGAGAAAGPTKDGDGN